VPTSPPRSSTPSRPAAPEREIDRLSGFQAVKAIDDLIQLGIRRGNFGLERGNVGLERGNVGLNRGNVGLDRGNVGLDRGNVGPDRGNSDLTSPNWRTTSILNVDRPSAVSLIELLISL
jgi:hypothetical protein